MGFGIKDRAGRRWPGREIPYVIDPVAYPPGTDGWTQIRAAASDWTNNTVVRVTERISQPDYVRFTQAGGSCSSQVGRRGGEQEVPCELFIAPSSVPRAGIALARQTETVFTAAFVNGLGQPCITFAYDLGLWHAPIPIGGPIAPPGAQLALSKQGDEILAIAYMDASGTLCVGWVDNTGKWSPAVPVSGPSASGGARGMPGGYVALAEQAHDVLVAAYIDDDGDLSVAWVVTGSPWTPGAKISSDGRPGQPVALCKQGGKLLTAAFLNSDGVFNIAWVEDVGQPWHRAISPLSAGGISIRGSGVALAEQRDDLLVAAFFDQQRLLNVAWVEGTGTWQGPYAIGGPVAPAGGGVIALAKQTNETLTAAYVSDAPAGGTNGPLCIAWVEEGGKWNSAVPVSPPIAPPGGTVALARQATKDEGDSDIFTAALFAPAANPAIADLRVAWVVDRGAWNAPSLLHANVFSIRGLVHELGHAAGLYHEQQRRDRDLFVSVDTNQVRIPPGKDADEFLDANFNIHGDGIELGPYDCGSVMHYGRTAFAKPTGAGFATTISPDATYCTSGIGGGATATLPGSRLTPMDVEAIRLFYQGESAPPGAGVALSGFESALPEVPDPLFTAVLVNDAGRLCVATTRGGGWNPPMAVGPVAAPPGADVALYPQSPGLLTAAFIANDGRLTVLSNDGGDEWDGPYPVGQPVGLPGGGVALCRQSNDTLVAAFIGAADGVLRVAWVTGNGTWSPPVPIGGSTALAGAPVALFKQDDDTLTAAFVDAAGRLAVAWNTGGSQWQPAVSVGPPSPVVPVTPSGIALGNQGGTRTTAAYFDQSGQLMVATADAGQWSTPVPVIGVTANPGARLALAPQLSDVLTCVYLDTAGLLQAAWVVGTGQWQGPAFIGGNPGPVGGGGRVALSTQRSANDLVTAAFVSTARILSLAWVDGSGNWQAATDV